MTIINPPQRLHEKDYCNGCLCFGLSAFESEYNCYVYLKQLKVINRNTANIKLERLDICKQNDKEQSNG